METMDYIMIMIKIALILILMYIGITLYMEYRVEQLNKRHNENKRQGKGVSD